MSKYPREITDQILQFRQFLIASWPYLDLLMESHDWDNDMDFTEDWIQANWELLVERELLGKETYLETLSITGRSRVIQPKAKATYSVMIQLEKPTLDIRTRDEAPQDCFLRFCGFCTIVKHGLGLYPPFDLVNLVFEKQKKKLLFTVTLQGLRFFLCELNVSI